MALICRKMRIVLGVGIVELCDWNLLFFFKSLSFASENFNISTLFPGNCWSCRKMLFSSTTFLLMNFPGVSQCIPCARRVFSSALSRWTHLGEQLWPRSCSRLSSNKKNNSKKCKKNTNILSEADVKARRHQYGSAQDCNEFFTASVEKEGAG